MVVSDFLDKHGYQDALRYLSMSQAGKQFIANLYAHVFIVEHDVVDDGCFLRECLTQA